MITQKEKDEVYELYCKLYEQRYSRQPKNYEFIQFRTACDVKVEAIFTIKRLQLIRLLYEYLDAHPSI